ncbi:hypothetical protein [Methylibium petroleiphilum]
MLLIGDQNYRGSVQQINPRRVGEGYGVEVRNMRPGSADLRPWGAAGSVYTIPGGGAQRKALYRMDRATVSDVNYWLSSVNDVDYVRSLLADDPEERTYYTGESEPRVTDNTIAFAGAPYPTAFRTLGVPRPSGVITLAITTAGAATTQHVRSYFDTFVTDKGEEGPPNAAPVNITCNTDATIGLSNLPASPGGSTGITLRRIYVSTGGGDYLRFAQQAVATTTASDNTTVRGDVCPSGGREATPAWLAPPATMKGLIELWNGMLGGFADKGLYVCEKDKPWAWPLEYRKVVPDTIVGTGTWQSNWLVLTTGRPRIFRGSSPRSLVEDPTVLKGACVAKKSIAGVGHGVVWAGRDGLHYVGDNGQRLLTDGLYSPEQWRDTFNPATIVGGVVESFYYGSYVAAGGSRKAFLIDTLNPEGLIHLDQGAHATYYDPIAAQLFLLDEGNVVRKWNSGAALVATFKSRVKRLPYPVNPAVARVISDVYPVTFNLYAGRIDPDTRAFSIVLKHTKTVNNGDNFRLPSGYLTEDLQYEVSLAGAMLAVLVGEDTNDLRV